jgi:hypothetical protein
MSYEEFGSAFVHEAVTPERIRGVVRSIAGETVDVGPITAGPGGVANATANGTIGTPLVDKTGDDPLSYLVRLPVDLTLDVEVGGGRHHYTVEAVVTIAIVVRLEDPLSICVDPTPPTRRDVTVRVHAKGLQAKMIGRVGDLDNEVRKEVGAYVVDRIEAERDQFANIDLRPLILAAWPT